MNEMKRVFYIFMISVILVCFSSPSLVAQAGSDISGKVTDAQSGETLPGVNILVKSTATGTSTDNKGNFEISVPSLQDTLVISFVGYQTNEVPINGRTEINIKMQYTTIAVEEMVVVGYSTQKKSDLTGSVSVVDMDRVSKLPETQVANKLQGNASGVTVISSGQPGEEPDVRIRGFNSFGNNSPLYVVDGIPTQDISNLNPQDVASIQVLKDAAAASIYGSRASNGVVLIQTKVGEGKVSVNYDTYFGYQIPSTNNVYDMLNPQERADAIWEAQRNVGIENPSHPQYGSGKSPVLPDFIDPSGASEEEVDLSKYNIDPLYTNPDQLSSFYYITRANKQGTDWFDEIFDPASQMNHNLSVSGGGDIGNYLLSGNFQDENGTLMKQYYKSYKIRANTKFNVNDNIRIGENLSYSYSENPTFTQQSAYSPIGMAYREQTIVPVYDLMNNFGGAHGSGLGAANNPVAVAYRSRNNESIDKKLFGNIFAELDWWKDRLTLRTNFGGALVSGSASSFRYPQYENSQNISYNEYNANANSGFNYTWSNTITYQQNFYEKHDIKILLGTETFRNETENIGGNRRSFFSFNPNYVSLSNGSGTQTTSGNRLEYSLFSMFGRVDYSYENRYLISGTLRRDGSSRFLKNRWGVFPAFSLGWRLTNEKFFPKINWLNDLKIRGGYGVLGNQLNVDPQNPYTLYAPDPRFSYYAIDGSNSNTASGFNKVQIGNPDAKWERDISENIGIDATLFNNSIDITIDYYRKRIKDLLYNPELPGTAGNADQPYVNVGQMTNEGIDASISFNKDISNQLHLNTSLIFTSYKNEIQKISSSSNYFSLYDAEFSSSGIVRNQVGHPVSSFYGYQIRGFWDNPSEIDDADKNAPSGNYQNGAAVGRFRYEDVNSDGEITPEDRTFLGNPNPDFTYGLNLGLNYKNFDLGVFWYGSQGNDLWNQVKWWTDFYANFNGAKSKAILYDSWTPNNKNATAPILEAASSFSSNEVANSYYVENGSYLRLKNLELGYTIPPNILSKSGLSSIRLYVQASNLVTFTSYSGVDPEIGTLPSSVGGGEAAFGVDSGTYPTTRKFLFGINLSY